MYVEIFDVEHGACALITTSNGKRVMIDCGHNSSTGWEPGTELRWRGVTELERLIVTNYDEDHVSGYYHLTQNVFVGGLQRNGYVTAPRIDFLKSEGGIGLGVRILSGMFNYFSGPPLPSVVDDLSIAAFCNPYGTPPYGFDDENNLSLVTFVSCGFHRIIFPGDIKRAGWLELLRNPFFVAQLRGVTIFVTSHHGRAPSYFCSRCIACTAIAAITLRNSSPSFWRSAKK